MIFSAPSIAAAGRNAALLSPALRRAESARIRNRPARVILAHRMIFELVPHQDAPQIGMAVETNAVEIENFALLKFGAAPNRRERRQTRVRPRDRASASE